MILKFKRNIEIEGITYKIKGKFKYKSYTDSLGKLIGEDLYLNYKTDVGLFRKEELLYHWDLETKYKGGYNTRETFDMIINMNDEDLIEFAIKKIIDNIKRLSVDFEIYKEISKRNRRFNKR